MMMAVAEATNSNGTVLGAIVTFVLYGALPVAIVLYIMGSPGRRRAIKAREQADEAALNAGSDVLLPQAASVDGAVIDTVSADAVSQTKPSASGNDVR